MTQSLWHKLTAPLRSVPLAPDTPVVVLGDVHGRADLLEQMLERLASTAPAEAPLVCVGDYIDRGAQSAAVLRRLHALARRAGEAAGGADCICLMGNHERMLLDFLDAPAVSGPRWLRHGGVETLESFEISVDLGLDGDTTRGAGKALKAFAVDGTSYREDRRAVPEPSWQALRDRLRRAMGAELEAWLRALPLSWQSGNLFVSHAGADPQRSLADQDPEGLLWGGGGFYTRARQDGVWVAHGHVIGAAKAERGRICVDTGAYATDRLTAALIAPGAGAEDVVFVTT